MAKLTGLQMQKSWLVYLAKEEKTHERDIAQAQGKVTEIQELRTRIQHTCLYCAEYIYPGYKEEDVSNGTRMIEHISSIHPEEAQEGINSQELDGIAKALNDAVID
jgi:hypothetical protein